MEALKVIGFFVWLIALALGAFATWFAIQTRPRRKEEPGFKYILINDDGSARELGAEEREYLNTKFLPGDGARPYIKFRYESLTPDGRLTGFLRRRQLPKRIQINKNP